MAVKIKGVDAGGRICPPLDRTYNSIEVLVFLFLIVPSMVLSFFVVKVGSVSFRFVAVSTMLRDLSLVSLVFFFIWRNGEPLGRLGLTLLTGWRDLFWGVILFLPINFVADLLGSYLKSAGLTAPAHAPAFLAVKGPGEIALAIILVVIVALTEETIFRGYLLLRFQGPQPGPLGRGPAFLGDLLPGARLRRHGRIGHRRRPGLRPGPDLPVAGKPGGSHRHPFSAGFFRHRPAGPGRD